MSCCGRGRRSSVSSSAPSERSRGVVIQPDRGSALPSSPAPGRPAGGPTRAVRYRYVGDSRLVVEGPLSGRRYFFARPGAEQLVDPRDAPSLFSVPVLRRL